jgi:hypothetical protein
VYSFPGSQGRGKEKKPDDRSIWPSSTRPLSDHSDHHHPPSQRSRSPHPIPSKGVSADESVVLSVVPGRAVAQQAVSTVASSEQRIRSQRLVLPQQQMTSSSHAASDKPPPHIASAAVLPSPHDMDELDYEALPTTSVKVQLLAGAIAGIAEHTIIYPIDAIKVRIQTPFFFEQRYACVRFEEFGLTCRRECR